MAKADEYIEQQLAPRLEPDERITAAGVLSTKPPAKRARFGLAGMVGGGYFLAAATDRRLLLIQTRFGATGIKLLNEGITELTYGDITAIRLDRQMLQRTLVLTYAAGGDAMLHPMPAPGGPSAQAAFADTLIELHRAWGAGPRAIPGAPPQGVNVPTQHRDHTWPASAPAPGVVAAPEHGAGGSDVMTQLKELATLHQAGILTEAEYTATKAALLRQV